MGFSAVSLTAYLMEDMEQSFRSFFTDIWEEAELYSKAQQI